MKEQTKSQQCFLCGVENPHGMHLTWFSDYENGLVFTDLEIPDYYNGYPGVTHGGIVAALLDETSFRAIALEEKDAFLVDRTFVTGTLNIKYRKPTPTEQKLRVLGWIKRAGKSRYETAAEIRLPDGTVTASCNALIMEAQNGISQDS